MAAKCKLSKERVAELKKSFDMLDKDGNGKICSAELGTMMREIGLNPSKEELAMMIKDVDKDGSGTIEFNEFMVMMGPKLKQHELREAFRVFDKDGDGKISRDELKAVINKKGEKLSDKEIGQMIKAADRDGDGMVNYEEFIKMMSY